ncbi:hypothetical protein SLA2020_526010 [Shorea laevis]
MAASTSLKEYLKRYESKGEEEEKKKKKKKKKSKPGLGSTSVLVVDEDPIWQKPVNLDEEEENDSPDEKPVVDEDIEVKRMRRLEQIKMRRAYNAIAEDGSGWVSLSPKRASSVNPNSDIFPAHRQRTHNDTPSPESGRSHEDSAREDVILPTLRDENSAGLNSDMSPPRKRQSCMDTPSPEPGIRRKLVREDTDLSPPGKQRARNDTPSPELRVNPKPTRKDTDLSPPRKRRARNDTPSPEPRVKPKASREGTDLSPPRKRRARNDTPSPEPRVKPKPSREATDLSPPRKRRARNDTPSPEPVLKPVRKDSDLSPPRQRQSHHDTSSPGADLSPPRRSRPQTSENFQRKKPDSAFSPDLDLSPPRRNIKDSRKHGSPDITQRTHRHPDKNVSSHANVDLSPPRKDRKEPKERPKTGLISGSEIREEISKTKKDDWRRFKEMNPSVSGRGAEAVYRDKITGERITKKEFLKSQQKVEEKPKEKELEWGKGLAQKREADARLQELELEKDKPFSRTRDDPELEKMLKDRVRWGDPMAHLVKKKHSEQPDLRDLGDSEKMKESGFVIPQDIPSHSWIKRGLDAAPNRYGIRPGRHWDGVDRSNGFEKKMFKRSNEKQATQREAYLWSVSDM